eukprot:TRINITY_DN18771_c0_g2_i1.p1 TRINITY_DN18771_c0_g2~~TRINITY_DN18771_c0_g2_i1.p1  ORF type:complete len:862 (+),score=155.02 TRINITY_DN18771_c0_g2_i1:151-2736(+)
MPLASGRLAQRPLSSPGGREPWIWSPHEIASTACDPPKEILITPREKAIFEELSTESNLHRCPTPPGSRLNTVTPDSEAYCSFAPFRAGSQASGPKAMSASPSWCGESPTTSRCGTPWGERAPPQSDALLSGRGTPQGVDWTDADEEVRDIATGRLSRVGRPADLEIVTSRLLRCLEAHDSSRNGHANPALYKEALAAARQRKLTSAMEIRPVSPREAHRRRGPSVPSEARQAVLAVLRHIFQGYDFQDREVQVSVARPAAAATAEVADLDLADSAKAFPRLEAVMLGRHAPRSRCCRSPVLTFFDVEYGMAVMCMKTGCMQPALVLQPLPKAKRMQIWGRWMRLNAGLLPRHTPPPASVTMFAFLAPAGEDSVTAPSLKMSSTSQFSDIISLMGDNAVASSRILLPVQDFKEVLEQQEQDLRERPVKKNTAGGKAILDEEASQIEQCAMKGASMAFLDEKISQAEQREKEESSLAKPQEEEDLASQAQHEERDEARHVAQQDAASEAKSKEDSVALSERVDTESQVEQEEEACEDVASQEEADTSQVERGEDAAGLTDQEDALCQVEQLEEAREDVANQKDEKGKDLVEKRVGEFQEGASRPEHQEHADEDDETVSPLRPGSPWRFGRGDPSSSSSPGSPCSPPPSSVWRGQLRAAFPRQNTQRLDPGAFSTGGSSSASDNVGVMSANSSASEEEEVQAEQMEAVAAPLHAGQLEGLLRPTSWARSLPRRKQRPQRRDDGQPFHHISIEDIPEARAASPRRLELQTGARRGQQRRDSPPTFPGQEQDTDSGSVASCAAEPWSPCVGSGAAGVRGLQGFARRLARGSQGKSKWKQGPRWRYLPPAHQRPGHAFALPSALHL